MDTLLALGSAATSTITVSAESARGASMACANKPAPSTSKGWISSLIATTGSTSDQGTTGAWPSCAMICERASTAPMVNKATGEAQSASRPKVASTGAGKTRPNAEAKAPVSMAQSMGLVATPRKALRAACAGLTRCSSSPAVVPNPPRRDSAMHKEVVTNRSTKIVMMAVPAACLPKIATSSGTPKNPVFGKAPTSAPKAASFQPM